jgi:hypothetical protein
MGPRCGAWSGRCHTDLSGMRLQKTSFDFKLRLLIFNKDKFKLSIALRYRAGLFSPLH